MIDPTDDTIAHEYRQQLGRFTSNDIIALEKSRKVKRYQILSKETTVSPEMFRITYIKYVVNELIE